MRRIFLFTAAGAFAGVVAAAVSIPFYNSKVGTSFKEIIESGRIDVRDTVTYGSAFGIAHDLAFGGIVTAVIAFLLARSEPIAARLLRALVGLILGAAIYTGVDVALDLAYLNFVKARYGGYSIPIFQAAGLQSLWEPLWAFLLPASVALGVLAAHTFRKFYLGLGLLATAFGGIASVIAGHVAALVMLPFLVVKIANAKDAAAFDLSSAGMAEFTAEMVAKGLGLGLGFALAAMVYKAAWLKSVKGQTEGRTWSLQRPLVRIGCYEGNEVFLPPDGTVADVHAQIQSQEEAHYLVDLVGDTSLNGQPVQSAWLKDGDRIGLGASVLVYRTRLNASNHPAKAPTVELPKAAHPTAQPQASNPSQPCLVDSAGHRFMLKEGTQRVGRDAACDIAITWDSSVSRAHAEVTLSAGTVTVSDLGSTNGTFVNGAPVTAPATASPGDSVAFGKCVFRLE